MGSRLKRRSLAGRLLLHMLPVLMLALLLQWQLATWLDDDVLALLLGLIAALPLLLWATRRALGPPLSLFRSLAGTVNSYRDADYSFGIHWRSDDEIGDLVSAHNALGDTLREQRLDLVQRELLLDTMLQNTPVAMLLFDLADRVIYANLSARRLLNDGRRIEGMSLLQLLDGAPPALAEAMDRGGDGLFTVATADGEDEDIYHLSRRGFRLNGRRHELVLLRHLTAELRRQEVQTWKKVIRVISHELNNSLAPVASLAHSGAELLRRGQPERLAPVLTTIEERARHLERFIQGYARFAKLPIPQLERVSCTELVKRLKGQAVFSVDGDIPDAALRIDSAQIEQALLNLLKNAAESGGEVSEIRLRMRLVPDWTRIEVLDRGSGMSSQVLANALLPFYSTKRDGTGLGLALAREIAEAHGGRLLLRNRDGGGLSVAVSLPAID
ncbi:MAG: PAS domain-containing protein [Xanthomonadales bacterium]|nr:PAS domain-containing protein [Xanthomonadales bacterium]